MTDDAIYMGATIRPDVLFVQTSRDQYDRALYLLGFAFSNDADYVYNLMTAWIDAMSMKLSSRSVQ